MSDDPLRPTITPTRPSAPSREVRTLLTELHVGGHREQVRALVGDLLEVNAETFFNENSEARAVVHRAVAEEIASPTYDESPGFTAAMDLLVAGYQHPWHSGCTPEELAQGARAREIAAEMSGEQDGPQPSRVAVPDAATQTVHGISSPADAPGTATAGTSAQAGSLTLTLRPDEPDGAHQRYAYRVHDAVSGTTVEGRDLFSGAGAPVDVGRAVRDLAGYLSAAGEARQYVLDNPGAGPENLGLFPEPVAEAARVNLDALTLLAEDDPEPQPDPGEAEAVAVTTGPTEAAGIDEYRRQPSVWTSPSSRLSTPGDPSSAVRARIDQLRAGQYADQVRALVVETLGISASALFAANPEARTIVHRAVAETLARPAGWPPTPEHRAAVRVLRVGYQEPLHRASPQDAVALVQARGIARAMHYPAVTHPHGGMLAHEALPVRFASVVHLEGEHARTAMGVLDRYGPDALADYLAQWDFEQDTIERARADGAVHNRIPRSPGDRVHEAPGPFLVRYDQTRGDAQLYRAFNDTEPYLQPGAEVTQVTVYSAPHCAACAATKRSLDKAGIDYEAIDLGEMEPGERDQVVAGHTSAPIVHAPGVGVWSGHRPSQLDKLIAQQAGAERGVVARPTGPEGGS